MTSISPEAAATVADLAGRARVAARELALMSRAEKDAALRALADALDAATDRNVAANATDLQRGRGSGMSESLLDRLALTPERVAAIADALRDIAGLPDPVGEIVRGSTLANGLQIRQVRVPMGVVGMIYEARPNVTADAAALCLKSGNAAILRGGSEAIRSNRVIAGLVRAGLAEAGLPPHTVQVIDTTDRAAVGHLITLREYVDVIVPRGGKGLISRLLAESRVPMIQHLDGNCHVYLDDAADAAMSVRIVENAKTQRYGTCNTAESLLVARSRAAELLPPVAEMLRSKGVEMRACAEAHTFIADALPASEEDYASEFLAPIISVKVVDGVDEAIAHINHYGSHHTDTIVTENYSKALRFLREVDSASVMVNASTRFADGFEYGLGAEIGISTDKIHARGPVGLEGLTSQKWVVLGTGQVRG